MIKEKDVKEFAQAHNIKYFMSSAKLNINIYEAFYYLADQMSKKSG